MDPMELSSLNELLDRIAALGVAADYDRIGLKPDQREINSPPVTHHIAVVEEQCGDFSSILRTNYVRIPELSEPNTRLREDTTQALNLESGSGPDLSGNIPELELPRLETPRPLGLRSGKGSDSIPPTHPNISDLSHIRQKPQETVHHYWARFLLVMNKVKDCLEDAVSFFCNNCTDKGILNTISRREITRFADLASIVRTYCAMESAWKTEIKFWDNPALNTNPVQNKRVHYHQTPGLNTKKQKPSIGHGTVLEGWLNGPCKIHSTEGATPTHNLRACWILRRVAKIGVDLLITEATESRPRDTGMVLTVFETSASNNM